jgi:replicative DNA helicase
MEIPKATESERGIASIALNHPTTLLNKITEQKFSTADILDPTSRAVVETILDQTSRNASCDVRVLYEKLRERLPEIQFYQLTEMYTLMPMEGCLPELLELVKNAAKRRALLMVMQQALVKIAASDIQTSELVNEVAMKVDGIQTELMPPQVADTKKLLLDAMERYQTGDDCTQRIRTGYEKIDNLTPIRLGDFLVIGGETKSGKTMLALNIMANLISE